MLEGRFRRYFELVSHFNKAPPERRGALLNGLFKIESSPNHPNPEACKARLRRFIDHHRQRAEAG